MKKILFVNSVIGFGSTGQIVIDLAKEFEQNGYEVKIAYGLSFKVSSDKKQDVEKYGVRIGNNINVYSHMVYTRLFDKHGLASKKATKEFLEWADKYDPDILWLHNIHNYYINYELLFEWIKARHHMHVKWTLHDCWTFTGHCAHFLYAKCDRWKTGCHDCPQLAQYPKALADNSIENYDRKKKAFTGVDNITLVTPSNWLKSMVEKSFLNEYSVQVIHNTLKPGVFKYTSGSFRMEHGLQNKTIILGVASTWNERKGLGDFVELSKLLSNHDEQFQIVLVGLSRYQIRYLKKMAPDILPLPRTNSATELAQIYSSADIFVNPTYEDTFPSVNMEAEACGTPVITYDIGGCKETIKRSDSQAIQPGVDSIMEAMSLFSRRRNKE